MSEKKIRAFWKLLREFQELISFVNFMGNHWKIMVFSHAAKSRELQKKIWKVKKSEINFKKSGHHNTSISAHLEHPSTYHTCSGSLLNPLPPSQDGSLNNRIHIGKNRRETAKQFWEVKNRREAANFFTLFRMKDPKIRK